MHGGDCGVVCASTSSDIDFGSVCGCVCVWGGACDMWAWALGVNGCSRVFVTHVAATRVLPLNTPACMTGAGFVNCHRRLLHDGAFGSRPSNGELPNAGLCRCPYTAKRNGWACPGTWDKGVQPPGGRPMLGV